MSGLAFAHHSSSAGRRVLLLESSPRLGGCIDTRRVPGGFWLELGAHTCYNSYGNLLEIVEACGLAGSVEPRSDTRKRFGFIRDGKLTVMGPLSVLLQFDLGELLRSVPGGLVAGKDGQSVYSYYSRLVGKRNYRRVLAPFLAAVPSQIVDDFPATGPGSLFKKRRRRKEFVKSFTLKRGLSTMIDAMAGRRGIEILMESTVEKILRSGTGYEVRTADGRLFGARAAALAVPPSSASTMVRDSFPELSGMLGCIQMKALETVGVVVERGRPSLPELAFVVPEEDIFFSAVTRDVLPDSGMRGFAFHFKPGHTHEEKTRRITEILGVQTADLHGVCEKATWLPSPVLGHDSLIREIDRITAGHPLAVTGNYFGGLAIEDCVSRSKSEWLRVAPLV